MRYISVCSGIEAATVAWHPLGWTPVAFSEIERFPSQVLAHHYPTVPNWGDMTKFKEWPDADVDVLVGGTPCQSFSVAGLRKGLADPRGNLMLTYLAIAAKYLPEWLVWESVPGVLSSHGGRDFGTFLGALGELGYGFAYRVLDAVGFGVPCRRRRVFVVAHCRDWRKASAVLFERACFTRNSSPPAECSGWTAFRATQGPIAGAFAPAFGASAYIGVITPTGELIRLSPLEIERLLGFPDDYTKIPQANVGVSGRWRGVADGPRYKALGNSMAVPCMSWIGRRIQMVSEIER